MDTDTCCRIVYLTVGILLRMLVQPTEHHDEDIDNDDDNDDEKNDISGNKHDDDDELYIPPLSIDTISHLIIDEGKAIKSSNSRITFEYKIND